VEEVLRTALPEVNAALAEAGQAAIAPAAAELRPPLPVE
jgi:hypothetical protein